MKVLHVGYGFLPWSSGGLSRYVEDLLQIQAQNGYEVAYFFSGRHYPWRKKTRLYRWKRGSIHFYEIQNSPIAHQIDHGVAEPKYEIQEPISEDLFRHFIAEVKPDLVHIQSLIGLPSSLISITKAEFRLPLVMTLLDYSMVCPAVKLFDVQGRLCVAAEVGKNCVACCQNAAKIHNRGYQTLIYELRSLGGYAFLSFYKTVLSWVKQKSSPSQKKTPDAAAPEISSRFCDLSVDFQNRRDMNVQRLKEADRLIAVSRREEEIFRRYLGAIDTFRMIHITVSHLANLKPHPHAKVSAGDPVKFVALNCSTYAKGAMILFEAIQILNNSGFASKFEFYLIGDPALSILHARPASPNIVYQRAYEPHQLNQILNHMDVGVVPSLWEEGYGLVGIEFLAKGIPVIGNARGGIPDYVFEGVTGWLNQSATAEELARIMQSILEDRTKIEILRNKIISRRSEWVKPMQVHFQEIDALYREIYAE